MLLEVSSASSDIVAFRTFVNFGTMYVIFVSVQVDFTTGFEVAFVTLKSRARVHGDHVSGKRRSAISFVITFRALSRFFFS